MKRVNSQVRLQELPREALVRVDGGAPVSLPLNPDSQTGME